jgi:hypothetical protein
MSLVNTLMKGSNMDNHKVGITDTYLKIKDWDARALAGYARRVGLPDEVVNPIRRDSSGLLDEILGYLFDDDWEINLMNAGVL